MATKIILVGIATTEAVGGKRGYTIRKRVSMGEVDALPKTVRALFPRLYTSYGPEDRRALLKGCDLASVDKSFGVWDVTLKYDTEPVSEKDQAKDQEEKPTDRAPTIEYSSEEIIEYVSKDYSDPPEAVVTRAGEPLEPGLERIVSITVITITRNESSWDAKAKGAYANSTNQEAWEGWPVGSGLMKAPTATKRTEGDETYYEAKYVLRFRDDEKLWKAEILHRGYKVMVAGGSVRAQDAYAKDEPAPVMLAENGARLEEGGTPTFLTFVQFKPKSWSALGLTL